MGKKINPEDMTLGQLEALAARMATAAATIRDAMALMGGQPAAVVAAKAPPAIVPAVPSIPAQANAAQSAELINGLPSLLAVDDSELSEAELKRKKEQLFRTGPPPKVRFTPEELAKKAALLEDLKKAREEQARGETAEGEEEALQ